MGLDTYASRSPEDLVLTEEDLQAFADAQIELCGGIFSGEGGSFRGKVYAELILDITDESLYQEWIPPDTVHKMYRSLAAYELLLLQDGKANGCSDVEIPDLRKFFKVCSDRGLGLIGWW
jgi:hypothetical protein